MTCSVNHFAVRGNRRSTRLLVPDKGEEFWVLGVPSQIDSLHHHISPPKPFEGTIVPLGTRADPSRERGIRARLSENQHVRFYL